MRISQENENQRRSQDHQQTSHQRPQEAVGLTKAFPKSARVLRRAQFQGIRRQGRQHFGADVVIEYRRQSVTSCSKLGITVSKRYGKAHERNRFKRVVREAFRELRANVPSDVEINVSPRKHRPAITMFSVLNDLKGLLHKIV